MLKSAAIAVLLTMAASGPALAQTAFPAPGFQDLEAAYAQGGGTDGARKKLAEALPTGTSMQQARAALIQAGATCRTAHGMPGAEHCLIHQYSLADGAADDVRWTILLQGQDGRLGHLSLDRYVDRHGSN